MKIMQISVFLENKQGRLHDICKLLGDGGINIRALNIAETSDYGILRMVVDQPEEAVALLKTQHVVANITDIVAVEVEDHPGGLAHVLGVIREKGLNVEYMYGFFEKRAGGALLVFRFNKMERAVKELKASGIHVVSSADMDA